MAGGAQLATGLGVLLQAGQAGRVPTGQDFWPPLRVEPQVTMWAVQHHDMEAAGLGSVTIANLLA